MEELIRDPLIKSGGSAARDLARRFDRDTVLDELWEMVDGNPDIVFVGATDLQEVKLARVAAEYVLQREYGEDIKRRVNAFLIEQDAPQ